MASFDKTFTRHLGVMAAYPLLFWLALANLAGGAKSMLRGDDITTLPHRRRFPNPPNDL